MKGKEMKKNKWAMFVFIAVAVIVVLGVMKNVLIKTAVTFGARTVLGTDVKIQSLSVSVLKSSIHMKGFKLYNPKGFPNEPMVAINEIRVDYDLPSLLKGKIYLPLVILRLDEMVVVKNQEGALNVDALKIAQTDEKAAESKKGDDKSKKAPSELDMQIDVAKLDLGKVVVKDFTKGEVPVVNVYDIGVHDKTYKNIKSAEQFATLVMIEAMGPTALKSAKIYAAATILGVGFLPVGVAGLLIAKDSGSQEFNADIKKAYVAALKVIQKMGEVVSEDPANGIIKAKIDGADITLRLIKIEDKKTEVLVSARKFMMPKPELAQGVLYQLSEILK